MTYFSHEKITGHITRIRDVSGVCMYLVEGSERAALIDSGVGFGDLRGYVAALTGKEPFVIVTHGHVDHAMGAGAFSEAYIPAADEVVYSLHSEVQERMGYVMGSGISGGHPELIQAADSSEWKEVKPWEQFRTLNVGDVFDLGGISLEICPGAGHTPGCVTVLVPEEKILFLGDAANDFTFLFGLGAPGCCLGLREYLENMDALELAVNGRYERCMFFHGPGEGPVNMLEGIRQLIAEVIAGRDDALPFSGMGRNDLKLAKAIDFSRMCRADGGTGNLVYDPALR